MAFQVSPGINVSEIDLTTIVPAVSTTAGAIGGVFRWGPIGQLVLVDSQDTLIKRFGKPTNFNAETFFTAANFLDYGNQLYVSRAANTTDIGTVAGSNGAYSGIADTSGTIASNVAGGTYYGASNVFPTFFITNSDDYYNTLAGGTFATKGTYTYVAKYPGGMGNSLKISQVDSAAAYSSNLVNISNTTFTIGGNTGTLAFNDSNTQIAAYTVATQMASYVAWNSLTVGDYITVGNSTIGTQTMQVASKGAAPDLAINASVTFTTANITVTGLSGMSNAFIGYSVGASIAGIANNTVIVSVSSATSVNLSSTFTGTTGVATIKLAKTSLPLTFYNSFTLASVWAGPGVSGNVGRLWEYYSSVNGAPGTSQYVSTFGNTVATDEIHVVVTDTIGKFTGTPGTVLEVYQGLSRASDAKTQDGSTNYYQTVLNQNSQYVWWTNHKSDLSVGTTGYGANAASIQSQISTTPLTTTFAGGQDGFAETAVGTNIGVITNAYDLFKSTETAPISLILTGKSDDTNTYQLGNYIIQNIAQARLD